ncbi:hypothetical protein CK227_25100 [Mesorhizobium sp. WSM4308]|nr:hypothetical protein CK232_24265 [Mesorhizobium sp. WSM4304]PBB72926.1 hypothetical protein CK227_25100 [Mesorhizobium sp. WSM4308]
MWALQLADQVRLRFAVSFGEFQPRGEPGRQLLRLLLVVRLASCSGGSGDFDHEVDPVGFHFLDTMPHGIALLKASGQISQLIEDGAHNGGADSAFEPSAL